MKRLLIPLLLFFFSCQSTECGDKAFQSEYKHSLDIVENILKGYEQNPDTIRHAVFFLTAATRQDPYQFEYYTCSFSSEKAIRHNLQTWYKWYEANKCTTELKEVEVAMVRKGWK